MVSKSKIPAETREAVAALYGAGERVAAIQEKLGLERGTVYWLLKQQGISPNRQPRAGAAKRHPAGKADAGGGVVDRDLVIELLQRRVHELEAQLSYLKRGPLAYLQSDEDRRAGDRRGSPESILAALGLGEAVVEGAPTRPSRRS